MKDAIDAVHGEAFFHLDNEEIDHFLVRLKQVDRVVTLANKDLGLLARQELYELLVTDRVVTELERRVH